MKQMGCLWRASKSRLVKQIRDAQNQSDRMKLRPDNIPTAEWRKFVKLKTSQEFKVITFIYKWHVTLMCTNFLVRLLAIHTRKEGVSKFLTPVVAKGWLDWQRTW